MPGSTVAGGRRWSSPRTSPGRSRKWAGGLLQRLRDASEYLSEKKELELNEDLTR